MKIFALTVALLMVISPVAAQQQQQQALGAGGKTNNSILPNNGLICIEEMVATFCNQPTGPNLAGYGSRGSSATSGTSAASGSSAASGVGAASSSGISTTAMLAAMRRASSRVSNLAVWASVSSACPQVRYGVKAELISTC